MSKKISIRLNKDKLSLLQTKKEFTDKSTSEIINKLIDEKLKLIDQSSHIKRKWHIMSLEEKSMSQSKHKTIVVDENKLMRLKNYFGITKNSELINNLINERLHADFRKDITKSLVSTFGSKLLLKDVVLALMPEHSAYIELFANSAIILLLKTFMEFNKLDGFDTPTELDNTKKSKIVEVYNDIDRRYVDFHLVLRDCAIDLASKCTSFICSRELFYNFKDAIEIFYSLFDDPEIPQNLKKYPYSNGLFLKFEEKIKSYDRAELPVLKNIVDVAACLLYLNRFSYFGQFSSFIEKKNPETYWRRWINRLLAVSKRLENVLILNNDFNEVIPMFWNDKNTFFFCDPPYYGTDKYYSTQFPLTYHEELCLFMASIKGKCMITHDFCPVIDRLYREHNFWRTDVVYQPQSKKGHSEITMCTYTNYAPPRIPDSLEKKFKVKNRGREWMSESLAES